MVNRHNTGGIIVVTDNKKGKSIDPLKEIGTISVIKRMVLTYQQVNISPITIVGEKDTLYDLERELADYNVIFLKSDEKENSMIDLVKIGINFLKDKCEKVIYSPVVIPMFKMATLQKIVQSESIIASPSYRKKAGHPVLLSNKIYEYILDSEYGMKDTIRSLMDEREFIEVKDEGIIRSLDDMDKLTILLDDHNEQIVHPFLRINIEKEEMFFNSRAKLLLILIDEIGTVKGACEHMALSYRKAWSIIEDIEKALGFTVVNRRHGGKDGGRSSLTEEGKEFLIKYSKFEKEVKLFSEKKFNEIFLMK
ncbi:MAG: LysR family transcriptional regulator [Tissierellia bacterium]|nr:LysR family transcriptional regulator [Tissierellia bacterium]